MRRAPFYAFFIKTTFNHRFAEVLTRGWSPLCKVVVRWWPLSKT
jgi:hypothetical protein